MSHHMTVRACKALDVVVAVEELEFDAEPVGDEHPELFDRIHAPFRKHFADSGDGVIAQLSQAIPVVGDAEVAGKLP
jgi:hypothetical protein